MSRKRRFLTPEDTEIWGRVAKTARPLASDLMSDFVAHYQHDTPPDPAKSAPKPLRRKAQIAPSALARNTQSPPPGHDLAHPLAEALARAPVQMDQRKFHKLSRGKLLPEARLDLHGMTLDQAHGVLNGFIMRASAQGLRLVLVITGKGKTVADDGPIPRRQGALRHDVPQWLRMAPLGAMVLEIRQAHARHGGSGAYYVYLRRKR